jgi:hypothetical protein
LCSLAKNAEKFKNIFIKPVEASRDPPVLPQKLKPQASEIDLAGFQNLAGLFITL